MSLFDNMPESGSCAVAEQEGLSFPASLAEKYRPRRLTDFVGLDKPKKVLSRFADAPMDAAFLFVGPSGTGKTSIALALCEAIRGELHHIPSQQCNAAAVEEVTRFCWYHPKNGTFHVVLVDEADQMSKAAQLALLSKLDATAKAPRTIWIFTCNATDGLEPRFLSRTMQLQFSSHGIAEETSKLLERVWQSEAGDGQAETPNFLRIVRDSQNNVRDALQSLQVELLSR